MSEELWAKNQPDDLQNISVPRRRNGGSGPARHIGCPLEWFAWIYPVVRGKHELAVALYIYRLRAIQHSRTVKVSNVRLLTELGIDRYAKYRALKRLAEAGIITVKHNNVQSLEVVFHQQRRRGK